MILEQQDGGSPMRALDVIVGQCGLWTGWFAYEKYAHGKVQLLSLGISQPESSSLSESAALDARWSRYVSTNTIPFVKITWYDLINTTENPKYHVSMCPSTPQPLPEFSQKLTSGLSPWWPGGKEHTNAGDSIPGPEGPHADSNYKAMHHNYWARALEVQPLQGAVLCNKRSHRNEEPALESSLAHTHN